MSVSEPNHKLRQAESDLLPKNLLVKRAGFLPRTMADWGLLCLILLFAVFFGALAVQQHRTFQTNALDLGNVDQALWHTAQGRFLQFTLMAPVQSRLALHVEPILFFLVPFYWANLGGPELLLLIQATVAAMGAWPLYLMAKQQFCSPKSGESASLPCPAALLLVFPAVYLLLPTLESAVLYDFHAVTLAPTLLLFAFWALAQGRDTLFLIFAVLAMACKEDMPLVVAMLGLYAGFVHRRWRLAGLTIGLSLAWFALAFFMIQPHFAAEGNIQLDRYAWLGDSPLAMVQTLVTQPALVFNHLWFQADLLNYLTTLFFPTAFLALFSPMTLLPMLPTLAVNLLSDNPFTWRLEDFHYGAPLAPFLIISTMVGIKRISSWIVRHGDAAPHLAGPPFSTLMVSLVMLLLIFTATYHYHRGYTPLARPYQWPALTGHHRQLAALLPTVPPDTPLFTQSNLAPHLSQRPIIYSDFAYFTDPDFPGVPVDDMLLDVTSFENRGGLHQLLRRTLLDSRDYRLETAQDGIIHLQPAAGQSQPVTEETFSSQAQTSFHTFAEPTLPLDYRLTVDFDDSLRLHGYSLHFNRQEEIQISLDLEPLQPLTTVQPVIYLLDGNTAQPLGATVDLQPTLVWYPPAQWPVGNTVRVRFNTLPWYTRDMPAYRLALGLVDGADVWNVGHRLRPAVRQADRLAPRLPGDGSLLELARIEQIWSMPAGGPPERLFKAPAPSRPLEANFDNKIALLGYSAPQVHAENNTQALTITLHWQAVTVPPPLIRFVQLIGPDGLVYGQNDSVPDDGSYPTQLWQPGEIIIENVTLPVQADRPSGQYSLHIGLYHRDTGQRLSLPGGDNHVEIVEPFFNAQ